MNRGGNNHPSAAMAARKRLVYVAQLCMKAQRYKETLDAMKIVARMCCVLTPEEMNLLSSAYHKVVGLRRSSCRVLSSLEKKEELGGDDLKLQHVKEYRAKIEAEICDLCTEILSILDGYLIPTPSAVARAAFYQKLKGDLFWVLADIRSGNERQEAIHKSFTAYESAYTIVDEVLYDHHPVHMGLALNLSSLKSLDSLNASQGAKYLEAMSEMPWEYTEIPYIPLDLVAKIILKHTTKEIASFGVVSKLWNRLIFTQKFSELHFTSHGAERGIIHYSRGEKVVRWIQATTRSQIHREPYLTRSLLGPNLNGDQKLNGAKLNGFSASWVEMARVRQAISPHPHEFLMITLLDDQTLVLKMDDANLVLLDLGGPLILGGYRCSGLWDAVEFQASLFKLDLVEPGFVEKLIAHP